MREVIEKHWQQSKGASTIGKEAGPGGGQLGTKDASTIGKEAGPGGGQLGTADQNLVWI